MGVLTAADLIEEARFCGLSLSLEGEKLVMEGRLRTSEAEDLAEKIREHKAEIVAILAAEAAARPAIEPHPSRNLGLSPDAIRAAWDAAGGLLPFDWAAEVDPQAARQFRISSPDSPSPHERTLPHANSSSSDPRSPGSCPDLWG